MLFSIVFEFFCLIDVGRTFQWPKKYDLNKNDPLYWYVQAKKDIIHRQRVVPLQNRPVKNVILFIGDGMGLSTITASRILKGQINGLPDDHENMLQVDRFPHSALIKTYNIDQQIPDSAATATAFLSGVKNHFYTIGVSAKVSLNDPDCDSVRRNSVNTFFTWALDSGKLAGIVTTTRVTHATPAATYAHIQNRKWESKLNESILNSETIDQCKDIARQLIEDNPGRRLSVILGGGRKEFLPRSIRDPKGIKDDPKEKYGSRIDGRNLVDEWIQNQRLAGLNQSEFAFINSTRGLRTLDYSQLKQLFGLFNYTHMEYNEFRDKSLDGEPSLSEMTEAAIKVLSKNHRGFVLLVEGGLIDQAHHAGYASLSLYETLELDHAIGKAMEMLPLEDTLILVTADHSQPLVINGYSHRTHSILGPSMRSDANKLPYTTLMYANGPGFKSLQERSNMTVKSLNESVHDLKYQYYSGVLMKKSYHAGEDVALYGIGPMSHLFGGTLEQSYIAHAIGFASCIGPYQNEIHCRLFKMDNNRTSFSVRFDPNSEVTVLFFILSGMVFIFFIFIMIKLLFRPSF